MKRGIQYFLSCLVICAFAAVITVDYWKSPNIASIVIVEIEPKKSSEKESSPNDDFKEELKEKLFVQSFGLSVPVVNLQVYSTFHKEHLPQVHLSLPELPPELV